jgi:hypothetical protein
MPLNEVFAGFASIFAAGVGVGTAVETSKVFESAPFGGMNPTKHHAIRTTATDVLFTICASPFKSFGGTLDQQNGKT